MKRILLYLSPLLLVMLFAACRGDGQASTTSSSSTTATGPTVNVALADAPKLGDATINVQVQQGDKGVSGATVKVTGSMSMAGMAPVTSTATEKKPGLYVTQGFHFTMAGAWVITADVTLPNGHKVSQDLKVNVSG
jgi:hypothetical protein